MHDLFVGLLIRLGTPWVAVSKDVKHFSAKAETQAASLAKLKLDKSIIEASHSGYMLSLNHAERPNIWGCLRVL